MSFTNVTLADLKTQLAQRYDGSPYWSADQARRAINEGLRIWNALTATWRQQYSFTTLPNDSYLGLTGGIRKAIRVQVSGVTLDQTTIADLDFGFPNWEGTIGTPRYWAPVSLTLIAFYPAPLLGALPVLIDAISPAPILVNDGDYLNLGSEELSTLLGYALHVLAQSQGITALKATRPFYLAFFKAGAERNATLKASAWYRSMLLSDRSRIAQSRGMQDPMLAGAPTSAGMDPLAAASDPSLLV